MSDAEAPKNSGRFGEGRIGGRKKGVPNKTTRTALETIAMAAEGLGGGERMIEWAKATPENEKVFWGTIYPKLLPLQITGKNGGAIETNSKIDLVLRPQLSRDEWLLAHGLGASTGTADQCNTG